MKMPLNTMNRQTVRVGFWEGHDFSRAVSAAGQNPALAAEGDRGEQRDFVSNRGYRFTDAIGSGFVSGHRVSDAINRLLLTALLGAGLLAFALFAFLSAVPAPAYAQEPSPTPPSQQTAAAPKKEDKKATQHKGVAGELVEETRESTGEDQEENANLKHAAPIRWVARKTGLNVHQAHLLALSLNFAIVVVIVFWAARKFVPGILRNRSAAIQHALEEARAASQDANRRLADIENRLRQLDVEIGQMQATAEKEADAEESRIQKAAEEDIRKVVLAAEREIAAAAKQARRELTTHTAGLAIALASKQINVDSNTDQVLVRTFASKLAAHGSSHNDNDGGKDGR
jgi:F-type H+-transporting ATPase subunit b